MASKTGTRRKPRRPAVPDYLPKALDALAYWVHYQNLRYSGRILTEGGIVDEMAALLQGFAHDQDVYLEVPFKKALTASTDSQKRFDIVVVRHTTGKPGQFNKNDVECIIEVKRGQTTQSNDHKAFEDDLKRLHDEVAKSAAHHRPQAYVVVVYQGSGAPERLLKRFASKASSPAKLNTDIWGTKSELKTADGVAYWVRRSACARRNSRHSATVVFLLQPV